MKYVLSGFLLLVLLSGCRAEPFARELEATMLVQVLGVDQSADGITLTAAGDPDAGSGGSAAAVLSASGKDLEQAKAALRAAGEEYVALTHVTQIVLGEQTDAADILELALKDPVLGQSATVWQSDRGTAEMLLTAVNGGVKRISSIELNSGVAPVSVVQILRELEEEGRAELPVLGLEGEKLVLNGAKDIWRAASET